MSEATPSKHLWRSIEELEGSPEARELFLNEFPDGAASWEDPVTRREFLTLMGASLALAGLTACTRMPAQKIFPYVDAPEEIVPGKPLFYASSFVSEGYAQGVLVKTYMARPTQIEGNPEHPSNLGGTDVFMQSSILTLYDPRRSQAVLHQGHPATWDEFTALASSERTKWQADGGQGVRLLTGTVTSPSLESQIRTFLTAFPRARWHVYEPINGDSERAGAIMAFGEDLRPVYRFDQARCIVSLDADFLSRGPGHLRYARDFIDRRRIRRGTVDMSRLYVAEPTPSLAGAMADHRLRLPARGIASLARDLARELGLAVPQAAPSPEAADPARAEWLRSAAADLKKARGASLVLAGAEQAPEVHALAHHMNEVLGNAGTTLHYLAPVEALPVDHLDSLRQLTSEMDSGQVRALFILGPNPVYDAPADLDVRGGMKKIPLVARLGLYDDETSELCHWHLPEAHSLESWGDARAHDGTVSLVQPTIRPLYEGRSAIEVMAILNASPYKDGHTLVRDHWRSVAGIPRNDAGFEKFWRKALHDGVVAGSAPAPRPARLRALALPAPSAPASGLELVFRPDPALGDGRYAPNAWLQELPRPITRTNWDNPLLVSPGTAKRLSLKTQDEVEISYRDRKLTAPVHIQPGQADDSLTVHLGSGRWRAGVGSHHGFNGYLIRTSDAPGFGAGAAIRKTGRKWKLVAEQEAHRMHGRDLVRFGDFSEFVSDPRQIVPEKKEPPESLMADYPYDAEKWAMSIDLSACIGCGACVIACQSENNIPVVGKDQVGRGRVMHWLRIDRYYHGSGDDPLILFQPVPCMQCEDAPCEEVCPTVATNHDATGLNQMVYNRCVGTRYCSNNCPYKVRRFNFLTYADFKTKSYQLMRNPEVTVRSRGVMEKCTYCVQRIQAAHIDAELEDRPIRDGEVKTACQTACPTRAIVFGDMNDRASEISRLKGEPLDYALLEELGTRPRTTYLARVRNTGGAT